MSSANNSRRTRVNKGKSFTYRENKSGPNTEPCGTPYVKGSKSDLDFLHKLAAADLREMKRKI